MTELITPPPRSVISSPDTQAAIWFLGALSQVRVSGEQTGGAFSLAENVARRGNASPGPCPRPRRRDLLRARR